MTATWATDVTQEVVADRAEVTELDAVAMDAIGHGLGDSRGLLVDLLQHEGLVAALLGGVVVPVDLGQLARDRLAGDRVEEGRAVRANHDDLVVADDADAARVLEERRDRGGDEGLA